MTAKSYKADRISSFIRTMQLAVVKVLMQERTLYEVACLMRFNRLIINMTESQMLRSAVQVLYRSALNFGARRFKRFRGSHSPSGRTKGIHVAQLKQSAPDKPAEAEPKSRDEEAARLGSKKPKMAVTVVYESKYNPELQLCPS